MPMFEVNFTNTLEDYGTVTLEAPDAEAAEAEAMDYAQNLDESVIRTVIEEVKEIV